MIKIIYICVSLFSITTAFANSFDETNEIKIWYDSLAVEYAIDYSFTENARFDYHTFNLFYRLFNKILQPSYINGSPIIRIWIFAHHPGIRVIDFMPQKANYDILEYYIYSSYRGIPFNEYADSAQIFYSSIDRNKIDKVFKNFLFSLKNVEIQKRRSRGPFIYIEYNLNKINYVLLYMYSNKHQLLFPILNEFFNFFPNRIYNFNGHKFDYFKYSG